MSTVLGAVLGAVLGTVLGAALVPPLMTTETWPRLQEENSTALSSQILMRLLALWLWV